MGKNWTYAHNGQLKGYQSLETGRFRAIGQTDSEKSFCWILNQLENRYKRTPVNWPAVFRFIAILASQLKQKKSLLCCCRMVDCNGILFN